MDRRRFLAATAGLALAGPGLAEPDPPAGTIGPENSTLTWTGGNISGANTDESTCIEDVTCETFALTLAVEQGHRDAAVARIAGVVRDHRLAVGDAFDALEARFGHAAFGQSPPRRFGAPAR